MTVTTYPSVISQPGKLALVRGVVEISRPRRLRPWGLIATKSPRRYSHLFRTRCLSCWHTLTLGSAARNMRPVIDALHPLIDGKNGYSPAKRILEIASFPYEHIRGYASEWPNVYFSGTARNQDEIEYVTESLVVGTVLTGPGVSRPTTFRPTSAARRSSTWRSSRTGTRSRRV